MNSATNGISIEDRLREVCERTDSREYAGALEVLKFARTSDPGNIYIAALKHQIDTLLSLSQSGNFSEAQRHELMEPIPGIIECALRDNQRQYRPAVSDLHRSQHREVAPNVPAPDRHGESLSGPRADAGDVQKELEALKLLYFQRASKCVMKGEYEQALAEVRRVFVVDPENTIAKEYASRVERLIQQARRLASEPAPAAGKPQESPGTTRVDPPPEAKELPHVHTERSTAWDDDFIAPKASPQTGAYADSLAVPLSSIRDVEKADDLERPVRKKSKLLLLLATVILTPLLAGVAVAIFSPKSAGTAGQALNPGQSVEGTIGAEGNRAPEETASKTEEHQPVEAALPVRTIVPPVEQKLNSEPAPTRTEVPPQQVPVELPKSEPLNVVTPAIESIQPKPDPPAAEPPPATTPAFIPVERDPQIVRLEKPEFPSFVWKIGGEGQVVVRVLIDANGKPLDSQILKSTNPVFVQPVIDAVMKSQFNPAQMGQGPVAAWLTIPFKFRQPK